MPPLIPLTPQELTGRSRDHVVDMEDPRCTVHREMVAPLLSMRAAAADAGFDLVPVSGFRDFERQLAIWNGKCRGERELLDAAGQRLDAGLLRDDELVATILHWSALPGASRHHWGSEVDVIDARQWTPGTPVPLVAEAYAPGGAFSGLSDWLGRHAEEFGFFRPYATARGGVQPEAWHLSYAPVSVPALSAFTLDMLASALSSAGIERFDAVSRRLPEIYSRYVLNVDAPSPGLSVSSRASMPS